MRPRGGGTIRSLTMREGVSDSYTGLSEEDEFPHYA